MYIQSMTSRGIIPGMERIALLCDTLGNIQDDLKIVHVAGTNGKGSVSAFISSILRCSGYTVGQYSSPALTDERDHFRINGAIITEEEYVECVRILENACTQSCAEPTVFEAETVLAFIYFAMRKCDVAVIECGMGGRQDATNIIRNPVACVFTSISLDHTGILGNTVTEIAHEKAGIIKSGAGVVALESSCEALEVIKEYANREKCPMRLARKADINDWEYVQDGCVLSYKEFEKVRIGLVGEFQGENAITAIETAYALREKGFDISNEAIVQGLATTVWPFRFERISDEPPVYLDGAHNPDAARKLAITIAKNFGNRPIIMILSVLADKDYTEIADVLCRRIRLVVCTMTPDNVRALECSKLREAVLKVNENVYEAEQLDDAHRIAKREYELLTENGEEPVIICCGSLSYLSKMKNIWLENCEK